MLAPKCPDSFQGPVSRFIEQFAERTFLPAEAVARAQRLVTGAMAPGALLVVRNFGPYQKAAHPCRASNGSRAFVVGDNEPVVWFWRQLLAGTVFDLAEVIRDQTLPISMSPERGEDEGHWATWGNGDASRVRERWRGVKGGRWKLCHVFQAAPDHLDDSEPGLLARFVRNFHPINQFWFASDYAWSQGRFAMSPQSRLGESQAVCMAFWKAYCARYPAEADWFMTAARLSDAELKASRAASDPVVEFRWGAGPRARPAPGGARGVASSVAPVADSLAGSAGRTGAVCVIRETSTGRFHLSQFGRGIGGPDREAPFRFQVLDAAGEPLAKSGEVTARELGIAERGRGDYDADKYHQTDFMTWEEGQGLVPYQALSKRVRNWAFF